MRRPIVFSVLVLLAVAGWFVCVDWSWFREECPHCGFSRDILQHRLLSLPIHERTLESPTAIQQMAIELGVPCRHPELFRWHKHRKWGLCYCAAPCINGLYSLDGNNPGYDEAAAMRRLHALAKRNPHLGIEFHQRVIRDHDWVFLSTIRDQILSTDTADPDPY